MALISSFLDFARSPVEPSFGPQAPWQGQTAGAGQASSNGCCDSVGLSSESSELFGGPANSNGGSGLPAFVTAQIEQLEREIQQLQQLLAQQLESADLEGAQTTMADLADAQAEWAQLTGGDMPSSPTLPQSQTPAASAPAGAGDPVSAPAPASGGAGGGTAAPAGTGGASTGGSGGAAPAGNVSEDVRPFSGAVVDPLPQQFMANPGGRDFGEPRPGHMHGGEDYAAPAGTRIGSVADGRIMDVGTDSGRGNYVIVDHGNGVTSHYFHMSAFGTNADGDRLKAGDRVGAGSQLGAVGNTGHSFGNHLHLEIHQGSNKVDPVDWLAQNKKGAPAPSESGARRTAKSGS